MKPAFPVNTQNADQAGACYPDEGMSLRDYFAAKAMQAYAGASGFSGSPDDATIASYAYHLADAMLRARLKEQSNG